jgi:hypothetical protein
MLSLLFNRIRHPFTPDNPEGSTNSSNSNENLISNEQKLRLLTAQYLSDEISLEEFNSQRIGLYEINLRKMAGLLDRARRK